VTQTPAPYDREVSSRLEALQRVTDAALAYLSEDDLLAALLDRISAILRSDTAAILMLEPDGESLYTRAAKGLEEEAEQGLRVPVGRGFAGRIVAERRALAIPDVDHADILNPVLRDKGVRSLLGVPLLVLGRAVGVLHVGSLTPREFTAEDRELLQLAADRAAIAIDHAHLFAQERSARRRLEALQQVTDAALAYLSEDDLLSELLDRVSGALRTDTAAILMLDASAEHLRARAAKGIEEEVEQGVTIPVGHGFAGRVAAERRAVVIPDIDQAEILNPILREKGIRSLLGVPLLVEGRVIGVLHVGTLAPREFTAEDEELLQLAADRAAPAIENARLFEQRRVAEALQRTLLPTELPTIAGLEVASRYVPAESSGLGGDWYDVFELPESRIAIAVGDVVGHGVGAATVMAQLRTALRAYAAEGHEPASVVQAVDHLMWQLGPTAMTTLAYVVLDPLDETIELVNAGHLPPLMLEPEGEPRFLDGDSGVPLGTSQTEVYSSQVVPFPAGAAVLLFTDGLVERRGEPIDAGLERLRALSEGRDDVERLCSEALEELVPRQPQDDVALVAARMPPLGDDLRTSWPATSEALVSVRRLLRRWLAHHGAGEEETNDIVVACQEACANAVEHAYGPGHAHFEVDARHRQGRIRVTVRDSGRWRPPRGAHRGRGLRLMRALMESVDVEHGPAGTVVVLERTLRARSAA
jgi:serine phosphatase RsbU (regulator of sigma subunit)/putative methionine-R-sulfoxide reductase with GAF domain/anti-sigma regulatory factor (Ser/Thr protein kinase)